MFPIEFKTFQNPISFLRFIPKLIEKVVDIQLQNFAENKDRLRDPQAGFSPHRGLELVTTLVIDGLWTMADKDIDKDIGEVIFFLDLTATFKLTTFSVRGGILVLISTLPSALAESIHLDSFQSEIKPLHLGLLVHLYCLIFIWPQ